jgi:hypothetical protein
MADRQQTRIDEAVGRAVRDKEFRKRLADNPKEALKDLNIPDDEIDTIVGGLRSQAMASSEKTCYQFN